MPAEKQFGNLSEFIGREVELFSSSDLINTAIYFTEVRGIDRGNAKASFELLRFSLERGDHQIYVRFPGTDYFIEMLGGGMGSGRGDMTQSDGKNVWEDKHTAPFTIYSCGDNLIFIIGRTDWTCEFNFMTRVASYNIGNPWDYPYPNPKWVNSQAIGLALEMKYLKLPDTIRTIQYCHKTKEPTPKYFLVDYPAYNFKYENHRVFVIEGDTTKEWPVKSFQRWRDGGTTKIIVSDETGTEHILFYPTSMPEKTRPDKFDDIELVTVRTSVKERLVKLLNIELEPQPESSE